jgi:hypothetical protein
MSIRQEYHPEQLDIEAARWAKLLEQFINRFALEVAGKLESQKVEAVRALIKSDPQATDDSLWQELQSDVILASEQICQREGLKIPEKYLQSLGLKMLNKITAIP